MRIERLDLVAFGNFTDVVLDLSVPVLQVVYGPNEAGKTTARAAFSNLLYDFNLRTTYAFVHPMSKLQLGARLRTEEGRSLEVVRVAACSPHPNYIRETIEDMTERLATAYVENLDRTYQTLTVDAGEYGRLCELAAEHTGTLILDIDQDGAYRAYVEHLVKIRGSDPLEWFLYLG